MLEALCTGGALGAIGSNAIGVMLEGLSEEALGVWRNGGRGSVLLVGIADLLLRCFVADFEGLV